MAKVWSKAALLVVAMVALVSPVVAQVQQPAGLLQAGSSSLPPGQYMMTNIGTGQSYYIFINSSGQLLAQDPRALQVNVLPLSQPAAVTTQPTAPAQPAGFGGMLKQGLDSYLQNRLKTPAPQQ